MSTLLGNAGSLWLAVARIRIITGRGKGGCLLACVWGRALERQACVCVRACVKDCVSKGEKGRECEREREKQLRKRERVCVSGQRLDVAREIHSDKQTKNPGRPKGMGHHTGSPGAQRR